MTSIVERAPTIGFGVIGLGQTSIIRRWKHASFQTLSRNSVGSLGKQVNAASSPSISVSVGTFEALPSLLLSCEGHPESELVSIVATWRPRSQLRKARLRKFLKTAD
jgi:hypothetical protein